MKEFVKTLVKTAPLIHRVPTLGGILKRVKYCVRGLAFAAQNKEWFALLKTPKLAVIVERHPYLFHKLQRPYLNRTLDTSQRLEALKQHYHFVETQFSNFEIKAVYSVQGLLLAELLVAELGKLELRLMSSRREKEGDLSISLQSVKTGSELFTLSFSIARYDQGGQEIFVGGLQGNKAATKQNIVAITRSLYGMRPKALLLFALQELSTRWGITRLRAVSDSKHVYQHFQKRRVLSASYDDFWMESGGELAADKMFDLPATFSARPIWTIKADKRQMYKRRYAMLAGIANQIGTEVPTRKGFSPARNQPMQSSKLTEVPVPKTIVQQRLAVRPDNFEKLTSE